MATKLKKKVKKALKKAHSAKRIRAKQPNATRNGKAEKPTVAELQHTFYDMQEQESEEGQID